MKVDDGQACKGFPRRRCRPPRRRGSWRPLAIAGLLAAASASVTADELRVAVASNFATTATRLVERFEQRSGHFVVLVSGSTGKLYAQIVHGARLDAFLAADSRRPSLL